jgi:hypothetical protein
LPQLFTITDEWNEQSWFSTGGTRAKKYLQSPDGKFYYFKRSQLKPGKDYHFEFWSEVVAYELGAMLGFNMLRYDIAIFGDVMGCICESMINSEEEELIEGVKYLQAFAPTYDPALKEHQNRYTFDLIKNSLEKARLHQYMDQVVEIIIFDALIGNGDRHQENWAFINKSWPMHEAIQKMENEDTISKLSRLWRWLLKWLKKYTERIHKESKERGKRMPRQLCISQIRIAPIYDSGSSLGRELLDDRIEKFLKSDEDLSRYIDKGVAEIHWENKKLSHFELIRQLLHSEYRQTVKRIINRVMEKWDGQGIERIIQAIDRLVPDSHNVYKIPDSRKLLIIKIITLRRRRLEELIHERV